MSGSISRITKFVDEDLHVFAEGFLGFVFFFEVGDAVGSGSFEDVVVAFVVVEVFGVEVDDVVADGV